MRADQRDELLVRIDEKFKRLYGAGHDDGDIPEIKAHLAKLNSQVYANTAFRHKAMGALKILSILAPLGGGATAGALKLLGVY